MRRRTRIVAGGAVAVALLGGHLFSGVLSESAGSTDGASQQALDGERALRSRAQRHRGERLAARGGAEVAPRDPRTLGALGLGYQLRWRETADAAYLPRSEAALREALRLGRETRPQRSGLGNLGADPPRISAARSRSGARRRRSRRTQRAPYGVVGDAQLELGRYREAFATFERMVALKPSLAVVREDRVRPRADRRSGRRDRGDAARARRRGRAAGADRLDARRARQARVRRGADRRSADGTSAARSTLVPGLRLRARADWPAWPRRRAGSTPRSPHARRAGETVPLPAVRRAARRPARARGPARRGAAPAADRGGDRAPARRRTASGSISRRPSIDADHGIRPATNVALARRARADRPSIYGDDALGWALARAGRCDEARLWSTGLCVSARRTRSSTSIAATQPGAPATPGGHAGVVSEGARSQPAASRCAWAPRRAEGAGVRRAALAPGGRARRGCCALAPGLASAHPLGNFTVNHYAGIELAGDDRLRPLRARPRRDPDLPGRASEVRQPGLRGRGRAAARADASTAGACR